MVAYSFNRRFEEPILAGTKCQTIRAVGRRRHARAGETVQLYRGMRTRHCQLIGEAVCTSVDLITIIVRELGTGPRIIVIHLGTVPDRQSRMTIDTAAGLDEFARRDGFADAADMAAFWWSAHRELISFGEIVFKGVLIRWAPLGGPHGMD